MAIEDDVAKALERIAHHIRFETTWAGKRSDARLLAAIAGEYKMLKRDSELLRHRIARRRMMKSLEIIVHLGTWNITPIRRVHAFGTDLHFLCFTIHWHLS